MQQCKHNMLPNHLTIAQGAKRTKQNNKTNVFYDYFTRHICKRTEGIRKSEKKIFRKPPGTFQNSSLSVKKIWTQISVWWKHKLSIVIRYSFIVIASWWKVENLLFTTYWSFLIFTINIVYVSIKNLLACYLKNQRVYLIWQLWSLFSQHVLTLH